MLKLLLGDPNARKLKRYQPIVTDISVLEEDIALAEKYAAADSTSVRSASNPSVSPFGPREASCRPG